jgi:hypothetical protein
MWSSPSVSSSQAAASAAAIQRGTTIRHLVGLRAPRQRMIRRISLGSPRSKHSARGYLVRSHPLCPLSYGRTAVIVGVSPRRTFLAAPLGFQIDKGRAGNGAPFVIGRTDGYRSPGGT